MSPFASRSVGFTNTPAGSAPRGRALAVIIIDLRELKGPFDCPLAFVKGLLVDP